MTVLKYTFEGRVKVIFLSLSISFLFVSCSSSNEQQWQIDRTVVSNLDCNLGRLTLPAINTYQGLELELVRSASGTRMYLNAFSLPFPNDLEDLSKSAVILLIDEQVYVIKAERFMGGQRLLMPEDAASLIITTLVNDKSIQITVGRYRTTIISTRFVELYKQLNKNNLLDRSLKK
jgi:hypothetical protein